MTGRNVIAEGKGLFGRALIPLSAAPSDRGGLLRRPQTRASRKSGAQGIERIYQECRSHGIRRLGFQPGVFRLSLQRVLHGLCPFRRAKVEGASSSRSAKLQAAASSALPTEREQDAPATLEKYFNPQRQGHGLMV